MAPGASNLNGQSMDGLSSEHDDMMSWLSDYDVPADAYSLYTATSSHAQTNVTVPTEYSVSSAGDLRRKNPKKTPRAVARVGPLPSQTDSLAFLGSGFNNPPLPSDLPVILSSSHAPYAAEPTVQDLSANETIPQPSDIVRPESELRSLATADNVGISTQGAQFTTSNDHLRDGARRALEQSYTGQRSSQVQQGLGGFGADLGELFVAQRSVDGIPMAPPPRQPPRQPSANKRKTKHCGKPRVSYRCIKCEVPVALKHSFKRHVESKHYPRYDYFCHIEYCMETWENPPHRRDKLQVHYNSAHDLVAPSESIIESNRVSYLCPPICALCRRTVQNWKEFYDCFTEHCEVKSVPSKAPAHRDSHRHGKKPHRDDSDKGNFDRGAGNRGFVSQPGSGSSETASGTSNSRSSDSRDYQQGRAKQHGGLDQQSSLPQLDLRHLQDQGTSQGPKSQCSFCQHVFEACYHCCDSPPSTHWCHACSDAFIIPAGVHHAGQARMPLSQPMAVADHVRPNQQALHDVGPRIPTMVAIDPSLYGAIPQGAQQLNIHLLQHAPAHGLLTSAVTQQRPFARDQFWTVRALHDVQVTGMSELEIEHSISDSKKKKAQSSNVWSDALPFRGSKPPARQPLTDVK